MAMSANELNVFAESFGLAPGMFVVAIVLLAVWSVVWKGVALWSAARSSQKGWFVALLLINTAGVLEIVYLLFFSKKKE